MPLHDTGTKAAKNVVFTLFFYSVLFIIHTAMENIVLDFTWGIFKFQKGSEHFGQIPQPRPLPRGNIYLIFKPIRIFQFAIHST